MNMIGTRGTTPRVNARPARRLRGYLGHRILMAFISFQIKKNSIKNEVNHSKTKSMNER
jgi:hypothetical protein